MRDTTIEVSGLRKQFGPTVALDGMTFTVSPGQITGFIGPNGAGKSTGLAIQATTGRSTLPISPWAVLGVLAAWAVGALVLGGMLLRSRDA
jgi:ABC-2 type transport system ATP-binding protein